LGIAVLQKIGDTYERKARLYPALLALVPVLGVAVGLYGLALQLEQGVIAFVAGIGGFYLLANIVRETGKRLEGQLYAEWGGAPTTQLQRHRDATIDSVTKRARHQFLSTKLGIPFPDAAAEAADPRAADDAYAAGTRWLIEHTRDRHRFGLLFNENVGYGYRRNALGLKPFAIAICVLSIGWVLWSQRVISLDGWSSTAAAWMSRGSLLSLATSTVLLLVWIFFFTKRTVRTAAFSYADMLLRACSVL
jgi:hypothetical protein